MLKRRFSSSPLDWRLLYPSLGGHRFPNAANPTLSSGERASEIKTLLSKVPKASEVRRVRCWLANDGGRERVMKGRVGMNE